MKKVTPQPNWHKSWKYSYPYDLWEIYGDSSSNLGYVYAYANRSLAELGCEVTWNDLREELIDYVKLKWEYGQIHYVTGDIFTINFESLFDVALQI